MCLYAYVITFKINLLFIEMITLLLDLAVEKTYT